MLRRYEGHFTGQDETEIFYQTWSKGEQADGTIVLTHGLAEHSECYHPLAKELAENGWFVMGLDLRGHGRSEGKRGFVNRFEDYVQDLSDFVRVAKKQTKAPASPFVMFGHSMGGLVTLLYLLRSDLPKPDAVCLSSPCLGLTVQVPPWKETVAGFAEKWMPSLTMGNEIKYEDLTRDEKMLETYPRDNLRQDKVSPGLFLGMQRAFKKVHDEASQIHVPMLVQIAGDDRIVSAAATREFFSHLTNKKNQLLVYPDSYHEIFNDLDRNNAIADLKKFLGGFKRTT